MIQNPTSEEILGQLLGQAAVFLAGLGESFWSLRLRNASERSSLDMAEVTSWYGGMGSFNDLLIAQANGHRVEQENEQAANDRLDQLRTQIYKLAIELRG